MIDLLKRYCTYKFDIIELSNRIKKEIYDFAQHEIKDHNYMQFPLYVTYTMKLENNFYSQNQLNLALELSSTQEIKIYYSMIVITQNIEYSNCLACKNNIEIKLTIMKVGTLF